MNYEDTLEYLFKRLPYYFRSGGAAYKPGLDRIQNICSDLNHPENQFKPIHIAGTNGKGSVSNMLASVLQEAGYRVGLFTSPHFKDFRERIKINGRNIPKENFVGYVNQLKEQLSVEPSFFEYATAIAFLYFAEEKVDFAVVETGLGGRLDSTNVLTPELSVITSISLDHTEYLGDTLALIAKEKAGIIKQGVPVVIGNNKAEVLEVIQDVASERHASIFLAEVSKHINASFNPDNIAIAVKAVEVLQNLGISITSKQLEAGVANTVENTGFYGRWYTDPDYDYVFYDVGHNPAGVAYLMEKAGGLASFERWQFVLGMVREKDHEAVLKLLPKTARYILCEADVPRAMPVGELADLFREEGFNFKLAASVKEARLMALRDSASKTLIFGSFFVVAEALPEKIFEKFN